MKLNKIIKNDLDLDIDITDIIDDSRIKTERGLFVASKGLTVDGHDYVEKSISNGAVVAITERKVDADIPQIIVEDSNVAMNEALNNFHDRPLDKLKLIGVTGTDGKTTTSEILYQMLNSVSSCGYIGTNGVRCKGYVGTNHLTTPLPRELFKEFHEFTNHGAKYVSMEVSSERLHAKRLDGIKFDVSIFTNLTKDHLDTHKTMENYAAAKSKLFEATTGLSIINKDDEYSDYFISKCSAPVKTFGQANSDIYFDNENVLENHLEFDIHGVLGDHHIISKLSGRFNIYNLMSTILVLNYYGYSMDEIIKAISELKPIDARQMEANVGQDFRCWIDYAHTAAAISGLIDYARSITKGRVLVVTGAAGSRDPYRSQAAADVCTKKADYNIFTIEDARGEDPELVINRMVEGITLDNYELIPTREEAIQKAISLAKKDDTLLILGKGLESFEKVNGGEVKQENDYELALKYLKQKMN